MSDIPEVRSISCQLEEKFTVIACDQRGCGKSFSPVVSNLTHQQIISDGVELIGYLKEQFRQDKIYLVTHSWGTILGLGLVQMIPQAIKAIISIGQVVDCAPTELLSYNYALEQAKRNKDFSSVRALEKIGPPRNGLYRNGVKGLITERKILLKQGGVYYHKSKIKYLIKLILLAPEYTLHEKLLLNRGRNRRCKRFGTLILWQQILSKCCSLFQYPFIFFTAGGITSHRFALYRNILKY